MQLMPQLHVQADTDEYENRIRKIRSIAVVMDWQSLLQLSTLDEEVAATLSSFRNLCIGIGFHLLDVNSIQGKLRDHIQKSGSSGCSVGRKQFL